MKTHVVKAGDIEREWFVVDAQGQNLGRLATRIAHILRGKHKPTFTPGLDVGDFVIVVNAGQVAVTGNKLEDKKYYRYSGYPGGSQRPSSPRCWPGIRSACLSMPSRACCPGTSWGERCSRSSRCMLAARIRIRRSSPSRSICSVRAN